MTFLSSHKFLLQLIEEQGTFSTYKADIINIDNCYNKCFGLFVIIVVYTVRATGAPDSRRILSDITVYNYDTTHLQENPQRLG